MLLVQLHLDLPLVLLRFDLPLHLDLPLVLLRFDLPLVLPRLDLLLHLDLPLVLPRLDLLPVPVLHFAPLVLHQVTEVPAVQ